MSAAAGRRGPIAADAVLAPIDAQRGFDAPGDSGAAFREEVSPLPGEALAAKSVDAALIGADLDLRLTPVNAFAKAATADAITAGLAPRRRRTWRGAPHFC